MSDEMDNAADQWISSDLLAEDPDLADLVEEFVGTLAARISELQSAFEAGDCAQIKSLAHQLKGAGGGHGYPVLTEKAGAIEQQAMAGELDSMRTGIEELAQIVSRVVVTPPA